MPVAPDRFAEKIDPESTVLLFGAGSSIPSGVPSAADLSCRLSNCFGLDSSDFSLAELASLVEQAHSRKELVTELRRTMRDARPTGGLINLPLYNWKSIYTTNYDTLVEQCYQRAQRDLIVYSSDFDFTLHGNSGATRLFKLHGTIDKDISDGHSSRLILSDTDYDHTSNFREGLYDRLKSDITGGHLVIIGHSLQDPDIKAIVNRALELTSNTPGSRRVSLLLYTRDDKRASLFEHRGLTVCFAGIDEFFGSLARALPRRVEEPTDDFLDHAAGVRPATLDVQHASEAGSNFGAMFNGRPATHADIVAGLTFERSQSAKVEQTLSDSDALCAIILGASGVGKTTMARQALQLLREKNFLCWEHKAEHALNAEDWRKIAHQLDNRSRCGVLLIDDAHAQTQEINQLVDFLALDDSLALRLVIVSTANHWKPRIKTPNLFRRAKTFRMERLRPHEIDSLLRLVDSVPEVSALVEQTFSGFSHYERKRRLQDRCDAEMFVCLKNIFASEKFDDIILREFAELAPEHQEIYRFVAALESAGVRVHRQLVVRLLGIEAEAITASLTYLSDIIHEYEIRKSEGIFGWRCRHQVIASIITKYKFPDVSRLADLFESVIDNISPTYEVEVLSMRELCNVDLGIPVLPEKHVQNRLLRKMMSALPGERVPRHRLIRNLIAMGEFEKAESEIRIFEKDFRADGPVSRYRINVLVARAKTTTGILDEDRVAILEQAAALAAHFVIKFPYSKSLLAAYCQVGVELARLTGHYEVYDAALTELKQAEERIGDPEIPRLVARFEAKVRGHSEFEPEASK